MPEHSRNPRRPAVRPSWGVVRAPDGVERTGRAAVVTARAGLVTAPASPLAERAVSAGATNPTPNAPRPTRLDRRRALRRRRRRVIGAVVAAALVVTMTAVGGTLAAMAKTVTIAVDGVSRQVTTLSGTVDGALATAGLRVGPHDTLAPAGGSPIANGSRIVVQRGRMVTLTLDGAARPFWTTATTVDAALAQLGLRGAVLRLSADRSRAIPLGGMDLTADTLHTVTLSLPGGRTTLTTASATVAGLLATQGIALTAATVVTPAPGTALTAGMTVTVAELPTVTLTDGARPALSVIAHERTVGDLLRARGISLGPHDTVHPAAGIELADGMAVTVTRVTYATRTSDVVIGQPSAVTRYSDALSEGVQEVTPGYPGRARISYRVRIVNGVADEPVETGRATLSAAAPTVTVIGTAAPDAVATSAGSSGAGSSAGAGPSAGAGSSPGAGSSAGAGSPGNTVATGNRVLFHDDSYGVNWDGLARCESTNNPRAVDRTGRYFGMFQFDLSTWRSVGGSGNPVDASPAEQLARAKALYRARGLSPWACAWAAH